MSEYAIKNKTEDLVEIYLDDCMGRAGMCTCPRCRADVKAFALNRLPANYVVTEIGNIFVRLGATSSQSQADIITAIMQGVELVARNPRH